MNSTTTYKNGHLSGVETPTILSAKGAETLTQGLELTAHLHDERPHPEDGKGNRLATRAAVRQPLIPGDPFHLTALVKATDVIAEKRPVLAALIEWYHSRVIQSRADGLAVAENIERERQWMFEEALRREKSISEALPCILSAKDDALVMPLRKLADAELTLDRAVARAFEMYAAAGAPLDAEDPKFDEVLRVSRLPLQAFAGGVGRAFCKDDKELARWDGATWFAVITGGCILGVSLGIGMNAIDPSFPADTLPVALGFAVGGVGLSWMLKTGLERIFGLIGDEAYLKNPKYRVPMIIGLAFASGIFVVAIEQAVQRLGLLAALASNDLFKQSAGTHSMWDYLTTGAAPLLVGFSIGALAAVTGYLKRRHSAVENYLVHLQEEDFLKRDAEQRQDPDVQKALEAYSQVLHVNRRVADAKAKVAAVEVPFDSQIAYLESTRLPLDHKYNEVQLRLKQSSVDDAHHAVDQLHLMLEKAMKWMDRWYSFSFRVDKRVVSFDPGMVLILLAGVLVAILFLHR